MAIVNTFQNTSPSNLSSVDLNLLSSSTKYFNNFFSKAITISSAKDDAVVSYFEKITDNKESAMALASAVLYTSAIQNIDPMAVLDEFKKLDNDKLNDYLCYFLNLSRVGTSMLGSPAQQVRNKYISRTILP